MYCLISYPATEHLANPLHVKPVKKETVRQCYTWNTPLFHSFSIGALSAALIPSDITLRVWAGSMISSTHNLAAA